MRCANTRETTLCGRELSSYLTRDQTYAECVANVNVTRPATRIAITKLSDLRHGRLAISRRILTDIRMWGDYGFLALAGIL